MCIYIIYVETSEKPTLATKVPCTQCTISWATTTRQVNRKGDTYGTTVQQQYIYMYKKKERERMREKKNGGTLQQNGRPGRDPKNYYVRKGVGHRIRQLGQCQLSHFCGPSNLAPGAPSNFIDLNSPQFLFVPACTNHWVASCNFGTCWNAKTPFKVRIENSYSETARASPTGLSPQSWDGSRRELDIPQVSRSHRTACQMVVSQFQESLS